MKYLKNNLANITTVKDLFGVEVKKLSMRDRIGFMPISIWQPNWAIVKELKQIIGDVGDTRFIDIKSGNFRVGGRWGTDKKVGTAPGYNTSLGSKNNNVSIFNPHLAQMILSAYCPPNATIYDAFGGGGTRGFIAVAMGHKYDCVEIREEEVERITNQQKVLNSYFNIFCGDSGNFNIEEGKYDFSYTCPPYYDLEVYSNLEGDLSNKNSYGEFLANLRDSVAITYKGLKNNALSVWVVGNFRDKQGNLVPFNSDLIKLADSVGFKLWDELIFWGASGNAVQRVGNFAANRKSVRVHEYILVFKKVLN